MKEENTKSFDTPQENPFENLFDFHILQQIFIQLINKNPAIKNYEHIHPNEYDTNGFVFEKYIKKFENYLSFSLVSKQFNLISKNTLFNINIYQNQNQNENEIIIQNIKYPIYLKLNFFKNYFISLKDHWTEITSKQEFLNRMLWSTSKKGYSDLIKLFILEGADVNHGEGDSCISQSCQEGYLKTTKKLIKYGANVNCEVDHLQNSILHFSCRNDSLNLVTYLIQQGFNVDIENKDKETPLYTACSYGKLDIVKYLISLGADINHQERLQETPLFGACRFGNIDIVKYIISLDTVDIHHLNRFQQTILLVACESKNLELIQYLLDLNLNINHISSFDETCLYIACKYQQLEKFKLLISNGADLTIKFRGKKKYRNKKWKTIFSILHKSETFKKLEPSYYLYLNISYFEKKKKDKTYLELVKSLRHQNPEFIKELEKYF